ncbi:penicillin-binding protein 2 [Frigidibacter sp. ROC022]|uniref:penicillin-binding protein 2 n=1 Tax=Frigidibacter sp. ROC022 TaxID=2971796 RepID=UPI00215A93BE|nr:penicillin-binding protein 2 [Frigidibacter sp. ROC022]MCR8726618.1 penicillin-binding protein 2 [Frigidibacter sp. ROC022]
MRRSPRDVESSTRRVSRRALLLGGAQLSFMGVLALRMHYMQVDQADKFRLLAEGNRIQIRLLPPARGPILDRRGVIVAGNEQNYSIVMVRENVEDVDAVLDRLATLIPLDPDDLERVRTEIKQRAPNVAVTIADRMSWEDLSKVAVNAPALPGITPEVGLSRIYPLDKDFAHVAGYVGPVSDYDLTKGYLADDDDPLLGIPKFPVGKVGVEAKLEQILRGKAGELQNEVNAYGRVMRELGRHPGDPGSSVTLTVDAGLQNYVQARMAGESAAAVLMDCRNGDLLAVGSAPSYDPNKFVRGISVADYRALTDDIYRPLANKAAQGAYPPGSTFKLVTLLAALDAGVIEPEETVYCPGHVDRSGRRFHCWKRAGHGSIDAVNSLAQSCDVYYYDVAERVGIERISAMARRLGLGERHDLPLSGMSEGLAPDKAWKRERRGEEWLVGDTLNAGIGQGFVLASPIQLAVMTARIASGLALKPRLIKAIDGEELPVEPAPPLGVADEHLRVVRRGMFNVSNNRRGTAFSSRIDDDDKRMCGKTGTSQVRNITAAERARGVSSNASLPWERRDHALFVCFAPYEAPEIACSTIVEHGGGGSAVAAPVARDMLLQALFDGTPPLEAYPANQRNTIRERQKTLKLRTADASNGEVSNG